MITTESIARELGQGREKRTTTGWTTLCPAHDDHNPSLSVDEEDGHILVHCQVGCSQARVIDALKDRGFWPNAGSNGNGNGAAPHLTLAQFAKRKGFTVEFLTQQDIAQSGSSLTFKYLKMDGQRAPRQRVRTANGFLWAKGEGRPTVYGLWRIPQARKQGVSDLYLVEGESDSLSLWAHGFTALGIPGASNCETLQAPHVRGFSRIYIVREADQAGETFEDGSIARLENLEFRGAVRVIEMQRAAVKDINDLHVKFLDKPGAFESELSALVEMARTVELRVVGLEAYDASSIQERKVEWRWQNRIPHAKLTLFVGAPGIGKSFTALDIGARLSDGGTWPDGTLNGAKGRSIVFSAEDDLEDTIVARLIAQKADLTKITVCKRIREVNESGEMTRRSFNLARDLPHLERLLDTYPDTQLVIVDPVTAYSGRTDTHKNAEMRAEVLDPLAELASRRRVAILAITHWNKGSGNSLERVSGSIAFPAAARQVWGFTADPEDPTRALMLFGKSNVGPKVTGLAFRIAEVESRATLTWEPGDVDKKLDDVLHQERGEKENEVEKIQRACDLIREMCATGEVLSTEIEARGQELGISTRTLFRARKDILRCKARKEGYGKTGRWWISLP